MAGWSILADGSGLDCIEIVGRNGCCREIDHDVMDSVDDDDDCDDYMVKLRCLFDPVLSVFIRKSNDRGLLRPIPARLGDGKLLDLFKLFWVVGERGGFDFVSNNILWVDVVEELGLDLEVSTSVKLIYAKYLHELEKWLRRSCRYRRLENGDGECVDNPGLCSELMEKFRDLLSDVLDQTGEDNELALSECRASGKHVEKDNEEDEFSLSVTKNRCRIQNTDGKMYIDDNRNLKYDDEKLGNHDGSDPIIAKESNFRKRKRDSLLGMLNWVIQISKCPDDPSMGAIPEPSKLKEHGGNELWVQAIRAREALLRRRHVHTNAEESLLQNNQKMHPSMYKDIIDFNHQSTERLRSSERLPTLVKSRLCSCCSSCSDTQSKLLRSHNTEFQNVPKEKTPMNDPIDQALGTVDASHTNAEASLCVDDSLQKHVSVGPLFQAEVPEWTDVVSDSDSKWLGRPVWPLKNREDRSLYVTDYIGKGRQDLCGCQFPGGVECIRFHIVEKRIKLKLELGSAFYHWRFDCMGEEVSLRWTVEEEKRFKNMLKLNPSFLIKGFLNGISRCFPRKTRENLVSYYFNVFIVQRRSYQNRVTPKHIDSDDDESELGSISDSFGHEAVKVPGSNMLICSQNNQCTDLG
ncbi:ARID domain-containing protein [Cephalotus follicularis]|uniref:ARID domain-containing protein n=1 Tax=Cephalotus follicularis TaxID=3775 RepID=A0A1Q3C7A1_CEPFO|nr:ARID domain-containing protein [Cephalotus follicularis]